MGVVDGDDEPAVDVVGVDDVDGGAGWRSAGRGLALARNVAPRSGPLVTTTSPGGADVVVVDLGRADPGEGADGLAARTGRAR